MYSDTIIKYLSDRRLVYLITLLLTVFIAYQLSLLIWQIIPQPEMSSTFSVQTLKSVSQQPASTLSTQQKTTEIANSYLFGQVARKKVEPVKVQDAPKSSLNYKVRGIYYSQDPTLATAIVQKGAKDSKVYRIGDDLDPNILIEQIHAYHILISRQGRLEKLILEKPRANLNAPIRQPAARNQSASSTTKVLSSYRRRYKDNPMALAKRFQAIPVEENGRNIGYKLKALRGERLLKNLNLQDDDVFVAVNGIGLDKPFQALDALKSLTTADNVALTVLRNGNRETLNFSLQ